MNDSYFFITLLLIKLYKKRQKARNTYFLQNLMKIVQIIIKSVFRYTQMLQILNINQRLQQFQLIIIKFLNTKGIMSDKTSKRNNQKISVQTRKQLIKMVIQENTSVYKASRKLGIKNSTGKMILRKYRKTGQITHFKNQTQKIKIESSAINQMPVIQNQHLEHQNTFCFEPQKQQCVITPIYFLTPPSNIYYSYVAPRSFSDMQQFHNINNSFYFN